MQIGNPLPFSFATIQIGGITAPSTLATQANSTITTGNAANVGGVSGQTGLIINNHSASSDVYVMDTAQTTFQVGTKLGGGQIASLDGSFAVRIANNSGSTVTCGVNVVKA